MAVQLKELFEDFHISNCTNAFFSIQLMPEGKLEYQLTDRETESNSVCLEHKETGITFDLESDGDVQDLTEYNQIWLSCGRNIQAFREAFANSEM